MLRHSQKFHSIEVQSKFSFVSFLVYSRCYLGLKECYNNIEVQSKFAGDN
jgi:hypothetical protein